MSIGPLGSVIYVNQQIPLVASEKSAIHNRFDLQNLAAAEAANDKQRDVEEVRPTEENHQVDEDREHNKQEAEEETPKEHEKREQEEEKPPHRLLDVTA